MFRYANWRVHGIIETLGKRKANPENKVYGIYKWDYRCINVKLVQSFQIKKLLRFIVTSYPTSHADASTRTTLIPLNTPVSSYDGVTSLCWCSSVGEARKVFVLVFVNGGTDEALDA